MSNRCFDLILLKGIMKKPQPIGSILEKTLRALEVDVPLKTYSVLGAWKEVVGESVAIQTRPRSIRNRILFVDVSHPTWVQQLHFLKPTVLEKVNAFLGKPYIQDIRFKVGKIVTPSHPSSRNDTWQEEDLDAATLKRIANTVGKVVDADMKETIEKILIKGAKLEQHRGKSKYRG